MVPLNGKNGLDVVLIMILKAPCGKLHLLVKVNGEIRIWRVSIFNIFRNVSLITVKFVTRISLLIEQVCRCMNMYAILTCRLISEKTSMKRKHFSWRMVRTV